VEKNDARYGSVEMNIHLSKHLLLADWGTDLVGGFNPEQRFVLAIIAIGCFTGIILGLAGMIVSTINSVHRRRIEESMKRDMIERGMSANEIATIIESAPPPEDGYQRWMASWGSKKKSG
jgi:hypothetical protein